MKHNPMLPLLALAVSLIIHPLYAAATTDHSPCRPDGLYQTPDVAVPYCTVYDSHGREIISPDHPRRIIGYFTSWRHGKNGLPAYLVSDIPWDKITHINYAFAHVNSANQLSVGDITDPDNPSTGMEWSGIAGAESDPNLPYKGHFNLLQKYKQQYPHVKTLISVGGWAESGGYFDSDGNRIASGGFYTMTTNADLSINYQGINTFADSAVAFIRQYGFDGVDIDYEYPTSMNDAGNPDDFTLANNLRGGLMRSYIELMKVLRQKLDAAGAADGRHYLLTIASPSSGYLLRGMEAFQVTQYLDYVNIMTYDLHGAWNQFVGHNAALFDSGDDAELAAWHYYTTSQYQQIGYLNTDWAYHYFRGAMPAGRINIGIPYYSRGWKNVQGGNFGLWGTAALPNQQQCPPGTGGSTVSQCGNGATGIDNLWHDKDAQGNEMPAGSNPLWHTMNLAEGIAGSYLAVYGLSPATNPEHQLTGNYSSHYDATAVGAWLWNEQKKVFLSVETEQSIATKARYVIDNGIGGVMFWELAGDYQWDAVTGEYFIGNTLTSLFYNSFRNATPYNTVKANRTMPAQAVDIRLSISDFKLGDQNFPINPKLTLTNHSSSPIPGGANISFDVPAAIPDTISDQSGFGLTVTESGRNTSGNNIGGLEQDFHRVAFNLPGYLTVGSGESVTITLNYHLPMPMPSNWVLAVNGTSYAFTEEYPALPVVSIGNGGGDDGGPGNGDHCGGITAPVFSYPQWPQTDWAGNPSHAVSGDYLSYQGSVYQAKWWTNSVPGSDDSWSFVCNL